MLNTKYYFQYLSFTVANLLVSALWPLLCVLCGSPPKNSVPAFCTEVTNSFCMLLLRTKYELCFNFICCLIRVSLSFRHSGQKHCMPNVRESAVTRRLESYLLLLWQLETGTDLSVLPQHNSTGMVYSHPIGMVSYGLLFPAVDAASFLCYIPQRGDQATSSTSCTSPILPPLPLVGSESEGLRNVELQLDEPTTALWVLYVWLKG